MQVMNDNLRNDCCTKRITFHVSKGEVKLFNKIEDAIEGNDQYAFYQLEKIVELNNQGNRPSGIVCHKSKNGKCVISLIVDEHPHYRYLTS